MREMEDILSFSLSGVYSLLLLNLTFSFLLGIRIRQMEARFLSTEASVNSMLLDVNLMLTNIEDSTR